MKKDISKSPFRTIAGWRGDSLVCPQAFGGDVYCGCSMNCFFCFCREMEEEMFTKYYSGWSRELVRACDPDDYRRLFDRAFGNDKPSKNWLVQCLRRGLPFNMGSKAETFCIEDLKTESVTAKVLELFQEYQVPVIFETKSHYIGLKRYTDIIKNLNCAVIVAIMGGSDTLNYKLEPNAPTASMRWALVKELNEMGIWTAVRWEPIMASINSTKDILEGFADQAARSKAKHVSWFNYRTSNYKIAQKQFESHGYNYIKMLEGNLDDGKWPDIGKTLRKALVDRAIPNSTPDVVNFPFDSDNISCCGVDSLFTPYLFNLQYAIHLIKTKSSVCWDDMEEIEFREPSSYERMKKIWNKGGNYYCLNDCKGIIVLDKDKNGMNIYGTKDKIKPKKKGLLV